MVDRCMDGEMEWDAVPSIECYKMPCHWPHCDPRILHSPDECPTCAMFQEHQQERVTLDVSNTGEMNRTWVCPADRDRPAQHDLWPGNRPEGYSKMWGMLDDGDA
jgi:hypothetical protein